ncbi:MAG: hypothetical protein JNJ46_07475 [Myxococcales bacterium]|nr:hypothetical protein [Myxococcales bacterium]
MARKTGDFNTRIHEIFVKIGRGETSPDRVDRSVLAEAVRAADQERAKAAPKEPPQR